MNKELGETVLKQSKHIYSRARLYVSTKIIKRRPAFEDPGCLNWVETTIFCVRWGTQIKVVSWP